jgi:hypothetical protein
MCPEPVWKFCVAYSKIKFTLSFLYSTQEVGAMRVIQTSSSSSQVTLVLRGGCVSENRRDIENA